MLKTITLNCESLSPATLVMMKRFIVSWVACCFSLVAAAQPIMKLDKSTHDFGKFREDAKQQCVFTFTNTGNEPLVIQQAYAACGCTVPTFTKDPIQPGQKGEVKVAYDGSRKIPGHFKKAITLHTNAVNRVVRIYIEGEQLPAEQGK